MKLASQTVDNTVDSRPGVSAQQMLELTGATYRQLDHWSRGGRILRPSEHNPGSGHPRTWPVEDVEVARCITRLTRLGLALEVAARVARSARGVDGLVRVSIGSGVVVEVEPERQHLSHHDEDYQNDGTKQVIHSEG